MTPPAFEWLTWPQTQQLVAALRAPGYEFRFVGGCIRDGLLGLHMVDIDLVTPAHHRDVMAALQTAGLQPVLKHAEFGSMTLAIGARKFDISALGAVRIGHTGFTEEDWRGNAAQRDLTINTLYVTPEGKIHDYFTGREDIRRGRVAFVRDPACQLIDKPGDLLRFFRFYAYYGRIDPDPAALSACEAFRQVLHTLPVGLVRKEMLKLLAAPDPAGACRLMQQTSVLPYALLTPCDLGLLESLMRVEKLASAALGSFGRLAALLRRTRADTPLVAVQRINKRWQFSLMLAEKLHRLVIPPFHLQPGGSGQEFEAQLRPLDPALYRSLILLRWAEEEDTEHHAPRYREMLRLSAGWDK